MRMRSVIHALLSAEGSLKSQMVCLAGYMHDWISPPFTVNTYVTPHIIITLWLHEPPKLKLCILTKINSYVSALVIYKNYTGFVTSSQSDDK